MRSRHLGAQVGAHDGSQTTGGIISFGNLNSSSNNRALGLIATSTTGGTHFGLKLINQTTSNLNYISLQFTGEYWKLGTKPKTLAVTYAVDPAGNNSTLSLGEIAAASANPLTNLSFSFPSPPKSAPMTALSSSTRPMSLSTKPPLATPWSPGAALWLVWSINDATGSGQGYGIDNFTFSAVASTNLPVVTPPTLGAVAYAGVSGLSFSFTNTPRRQLPIHRAHDHQSLNPLQPMVQPRPSHRIELRHYDLPIPQTTNQPQKFYTVTSP